MVAHAFNPSTWEAEASEFLSSRPAWSTKKKQKHTKQNKTKKTKKPSTVMLMNLPSQPTPRVPSFRPNTFVAKHGRIVSLYVNLGSRDCLRVTAVKLHVCV